MNLRSLTIIVLRLYTIYLIVEVISQFALVLPMLWAVAKEGPDGATMPTLFSLAIVLLGTLLVAVILWLSAFRLSSLIVKGHDVDLSLTSLNKENLYAFAFVFLGIWFVLSSVYSVIQTGYNFFALDFPLPESNPTKGRYFWPFLGHSLTLLAGFLCVFRARIWTSKLIRLEERQAKLILRQAQDDGNGSQRRS